MKKIILLLFLCSCTNPFVDPSYSIKNALTPAYKRSQIFNNMPTGDSEVYYSDGTKYDKNLTNDEKKALIKKHIMDTGPIYNIPANPVSSEQKASFGQNDSYGQGYEDGCLVASSIIGSGSFRLIKAKIDGYKLSSDIWYLRGFQDAMSLCTFSFDWETH